MKKYKPQEIRNFTTFFLIGVCTNITTVGAPLFLSSKSLNDTQISTIIGITFLAAAFAPLAGAISDMLKHPKRFIATLGIIYSLSALLILFTTNVTTLKMLMLMFATTAGLSFGLFESIMSVVCHEKGYNFGFIRSGMSLGYGMGIVLALPFMIFADALMLLYLSIILGILVALFVLQVDDNYHKKSEVHYATEVKFMFKNKVFMIILFTMVILFSVNSIKLAYQIIKLEGIDTSYYIIAAISFILIVPELFLLPRHSKLFGHLTFGKTLVISNIIIIVHISIVGLSIIAHEVVR